MLMDEVINHPQRIGNFLYLYSLLLESFYTSEDNFIIYHYYTGNYNIGENQTILKLHQMYEKQKDILEGTKILEEYLNNTMESDIKEFLKLENLKSRFENIFKLIDSISCEKSKLHSQVLINGLQTMLKILIKKDDFNKTVLKNHEIISFLYLISNTSKSLLALNEFFNEEYLKYKFKSKDSYEIFRYYSNVFISLSLLFILAKINRYYIKNPHKLQGKKKK